MAPSKFFFLFFVLAVLHAVNPANSESFIGVNYGEVADNLPPPAATAKLLQSTVIQKVRLYGSNPDIIKALANTGIEIMIGTPNGDIPKLATDLNAARTWVRDNVVTFVPASKITLISVGNEVTSFGDEGLKSQIAPAMRNVRTALDEAKLQSVKVSAVHTMAILENSEPPSAGRFVAGITDILKAILQFNNETGSPFTVNPYPYFAYRSDPRPETLSFCLFQPNPGRLDSNSKIKYMNMFDAQVDAVRSAINSLGFPNVDIVVAETGWPYKGDPDEVGASVENAKAYNGNLIAHLRSMAGTPLMPGKPVDTYLFALYDEDQKSGPGSERAFGLFKPDLTMTYDIGLLTKTSSNTSQDRPAGSTKAPTAATKAPTASPPRPTKGAWCVPKAGVSEAQLQANLDYACSHGIDCSPVKAGGACFEPNTVASHAGYAMNLLYHSGGQNSWSCDFSQTATLTSKNPSYEGCVYTGGSI